MARQAVPVMSRLEQKIERIPFGGCWVFMGALNQSGYGWIGSGGRAAGTDRAHRITYRHFKGEIPAGKEIDHLCRNRSCCNPEHLEAVTRKVNAQRGDCGKVTGAKRRALTHCKRGHEFSTNNTYVWKNHRICRACRKEGN